MREQLEVQDWNQRSERMYVPLHRKVSCRHQTRATHVRFNSWCARFRFLIQIQFGVHTARPAWFFCAWNWAADVQFRWFVDYKRPGASIESWFWSVYCIFDYRTIYTIIINMYILCRYTCAYFLKSWFKSNLSQNWFLRFHEVWQCVLLSSSWLASESASRFSAQLK